MTLPADVVGTGQKSTVKTTNRGSVKLWCHSNTSKCFLILFIEVKQTFRSLGAFPGCPEEDALGPKPCPLNYSVQINQNPLGSNRTVWGLYLWFLLLSRPTDTPLNSFLEFYCKEDKKCKSFTCCKQITLLMCDTAWQIWWNYGTGWCFCFPVRTACNTTTPVVHK